MGPYGWFGSSTQVRPGLILIGEPSFAVSVYGRLWSARDHTPGTATPPVSTSAFPAPTVTATGPGVYCVSRITTLLAHTWPASVVPWRLPYSQRRYWPTAAFHTQDDLVVPTCSLTPASGIAVALVSPGARYWNSVGGGPSPGRACWNS